MPGASTQQKPVNTPLSFSSALQSLPKKSVQLDLNTL